MNGTDTSYAFVLLVVGCAVALSIFIKTLLKKAGIPPLVGFIFLGFVINLLNSQWTFLQGGAEDILQFLAKLGIVTMLFRIGLESKLTELLKQLKNASLVWLGDVSVSALAGFFAARCILGFGLIPSLFTATAFTATSVGISVGTWKDSEALSNPVGKTLLDVAEMYDISSVLFMAVIFTLAPLLQHNTTVHIAPLLFQELGRLLIILLLFITLCVLFSVFVEKRFTDFIKHLEPAPDPMLTLAAVGFAISAIAGLIGFSLVIGAFFAGLVFSRDPQVVKLEYSFEPIYEFFTPFFFIGIGLRIDIHTLLPALGMGAVLLLFAILSKITGAGLPTLASRSVKNATVLGISMVPRAEVSMVVMQHGLLLGAWAVPQKLFGAMVVVSLASCLITPLAARFLLKKYFHK